jgi:hypothetical protein
VPGHAINNLDIPDFDDTETWEEAPTDAPNSNMPAWIEYEPIAEFLFNDRLQPGIDSSRHGNDLSVVGAARTAIDKDRGNVLFCDGKESYLEFVAGKNEGLSKSIPIGNDPYSISVWIFPTENRENGIIGWGNYGETGETTALQTQGSHDIMHVWWGNDLKVNVGSYKDVWSHLACTFDGTSRACFWNGKEMGRDTPRPHSAKSQHLHLGHTHHGVYFSGLLDDVRLYDVALAKEHVVQLASEEGEGQQDYIEEDGEQQEGLEAYEEYEEGEGMEDDL